MKKILLFIGFVMLIFGSSLIFAANEVADNQSIKASNHAPEGENRITAKEAKAMIERIHEIRDMDKSNLTKNEKAELRKELKDMKQSIRKDGGYIVIGTGTLVLIIILILLLT
ncbi:hypothetical protein MASR1M74_22700 [Lentimicrobium sp.]